MGIRLLKFYTSREREERGDFHLMVGLITGVHTDGNNYCVGEEDVMWRDCLNFLPQTSPRLPLGETETSLAKFIFSAHSSANIVRRKPVGVITLTTLFLMFIHLQKYIRQISENNEDLQPRAVWLDVLCLPCLLSVKNDQCFTSPLTTGRYSHHRGTILNVWGKIRYLDENATISGICLASFSLITFVTAVAGKNKDLAIGER